MKVETIQVILFWIFFVLAIIFFLWYLLGGSPTLEQSLLVLLIGSMIKLSHKIGRIESEIRSLALAWMDI